MRAAVLALPAALWGCSANDASPMSGADDAGPGPDRCSVDITLPAASAIATPPTTIRAAAVVTPTPDATAVPRYSWRVTFDGLPIRVTFAQPDESQIDFPASTPGIYDIGLDVAGLPALCPPATASLNVAAAGANTGVVRLRVVPRSSAATPSLDKTLVIIGGADTDLGVVGVDPGVVASLQVSGPGGGVPAYLRFSPIGPGATVEAFSDGAGNAAVPLAPQPYSVLVVPSVPGLAPRQLASWSPVSSNRVLGVDAGAAVSGTVRDPASAPVAGATVQLSIDGVPSTLATTGADGGFTLRAVTGGSVVTVQVSPPAASGLPRLSATSQSFDLQVPLQIAYAAGLGRKDLAGIVVRRDLAAVANARVMVVGSLPAVVGASPAVATVTAGTTVAAAGEVRIATTADLAGRLPSVLVPSAGLVVVIAPPRGDLAVVALDTTGGLPANLDAPAAQPIAISALDRAGSGLPGATLDLVPTGALALAAAPAPHVTADGSGTFTHLASGELLTFASGGHYDLRFHDPIGRAAPRLVTDRTADTIASSYMLPAAIKLRGELRLGGTQVLAGASVQILCETCTGIDREWPIAEAMSSATGRFVVAVPDPGTL